MIRFTLLVFILILLHVSVSAQTVNELTDRKSIIYATNLKDYLLNPVDSLSFDIYYPTGATSNKKYPVYFSLHGGSFTTATKRSVTEFSDEIADYGFIVIAPDYRVGYVGSDSLGNCTPGNDSTGLEGAIYRAQQDVNACIRYIANHADLYNIDTSAIFVGGASAGGTLTLNVGYVTDSLAAVNIPDIVAQWGGVQTSGNKEPFNYKIKGLCPMWGGLPAWNGLISAKSAIPSILFKGAHDTNLPNGSGYYQGCKYGPYVVAGQGIYDQLTALNTPSVFHFQPNGVHAAYDNLFCIKNASCFFKAIINKTPYSGSYQYYNSSCQ